MEGRKVSETLNIQTELIMPAHTNPIGNLMGGHLLSWMDVCAGISAIKHSGGISVTASLDNVSFNLPIKMGNGNLLNKKLQMSQCNLHLPICSHILPFT